MNCWIAAFTMLESWKRGMTLTIEQIAQELGEQFVDAETNNTGINVKQASKAIQQLGLRKEPPVNPSIGRWLELSKGSPLFVVVGEELSPDMFAVHARVVVSIVEVPNSNQAMVTYNDPAGNSLSGSQETQSIRDFITHYEQLAGTNWAGVQIIHY